MRVILTAAIGLLMWGGLYAQVDPPSRVARLSYVYGPVSFQPAGVDDWVNAPLNRPLTTGDHIWSDDRANAELHIGSTALRAGNLTGFSFLNLDDRTVQIQLSQGSLQISLHQLDQDEGFEVDTPNLALSLLRPGDYRIDVDPGGQYTIVTVRQGEAEATGGGQSFPVRTGEQARVSGGDTLAYDLENAPAPDEWENWCASRDRREEQSQSARYVSREVIGYEDLDQYGGWRQAEGYGMVWYPRQVAPGWAPYHYGHWAWVEPWGWTWVDDAPWGFAPFHYGRWVYAGGGWGWVPGPIVRRPVYAPALVAFVGGSGFNLSISLGGGRGGVAWFPLGPRDVYVPSYRTSQRYFGGVNNTVNNVNITRIYNTTVVNNNTTVINNVNINNTYVNRNAPGAVTAVPQDVFVRSRPVAQAAVAVPASALQSAQFSRSVAIAPSRQSVLGPGSAAGPGVRPPAAVVNRAVVARATPPPAPVPFAARQNALQANPGQPVPQEVMQQLQRQPNTQVRPVFRQAPAVRAGAPPMQPSNTGGPQAPAAAQAPNRPAAPTANLPGAPAYRPAPAAAQPVPAQASPAQPGAPAVHAPQAQRDYNYRPPQAPVPAPANNRPAPAAVQPAPAQPNAPAVRPPQPAREDSYRPAPAPAPAPANNRPAPAAVQPAPVQPNVPAVRPPQPAREDTYRPPPAPVRQPEVVHPQAPAREPEPRREAQQQHPAQQHNVPPPAERQQARPAPEQKPHEAARENKADSKKEEKKDDHRNK